MRFIDKTIQESDITPKDVFENRRSLIKTAAAGGFGMDLAPWFSREALASSPEKLAATLNATYSVKEEPTPYKYVTGYNNFYEFGTDKADPAAHANTLQTRPWTISIEGLVKKPVTLDIDALLKLAPIEERIYRLRCVEGWSMVIPWDGYSLSKLINKVEPLGSAKYVEFISLADRKQMPGVSSNILDWPYREGLRMDEAMNPLTLLTLGLYGEVLPKQNGAPVRIVVPWKYGFKSAKSIVKIRFTEEMPKTSWSQFDSREYGFYSNVNPQVDHPRWSQATERRIGDPKGMFAPKIKTQMFNGYADQVASMYAGMDLKKIFLSMMIKKMRILFLIGIASCLQTLVFAQEAPVKTIASLDVPRYMGTWYEIAKFPNWFQKKCVSNTQAVYSVKPDGNLKVLNSCKTADGEISQAEGTARQLGGSDSPKLEVRFAPAWLSFLPMVWGDYWVVDLDPQYQVAAVSGPRREYLWVLSRTPQLDKKTYEALLQRLQNQQFDIRKLELTQQLTSPSKN